MCRYFPDAGVRSLRQFSRSTGWAYRCRTMVSRARLLATRGLLRWLWTSEDLDLDFRGDDTDPFWLLRLLLLSKLTSGKPYPSCGAVSVDQHTSRLRSGSECPEISLSLFFLFFCHICLLRALKDSKSHGIVYSQFACIWLSD